LKVFRSCSFLGALFGPKVIFSKSPSETRKFNIQSCS
jgi:hypothetical protein